MRALLDTQVWLWMTLAPERLSPAMREWLVRPEQDLVLSVGSVWEMALKEAKGKLRVPGRVENYVPTRSAAMGINFLPITHSHVTRGPGLPRHHKDPFDRLLIAQAQLEGISVVTSDPWFSRYDVDVIAA